MAHHNKEMLKYQELSRERKFDQGTNSVTAKKASKKQISPQN